MDSAGQSDYKKTQQLKRLPALLWAAVIVCEVEPLRPSSQRCGTHVQNQSLLLIKGAVGRCERGHGVRACVCVCRVVGAAPTDLSKGFEMHSGIILGTGYQNWQYGGFFFLPVVT